MPLLPTCSLFLHALTQTLKKLPFHRKNNAIQKSNKRLMVRTIKEETHKGQKMHNVQEPIKRERANPFCGKK
jgi:hypothetical protein